MGYPNGFLRKNRSSIVFVVAPTANYIIFRSRIPKQNALKNRRTFVARVKFLTNQRDYNKMLGYLREWYESTDDVALLKRLEGATAGNLPLVTFDDKFYLDFNSSTKELAEELISDVIHDL